MIAPDDADALDPAKPPQPVGPTPVVPAVGPARAARDDSLLLHTAVMGDLRVPNASERGAELQLLSDRAALYASRARGEGTRRVYRSAWRGYAAWCRSLGREPLGGDPDLLAMYVTRRADDGVAVSTLRVDLAAIRTAHLLAGIPLDLHDPRLAMVVEGITRKLGTRPRRQAAPAVPDVLRLFLAVCASSDTALGARDRAMLLLGFGAALRRSELVALQLGDLEGIPNRGVRVLIRRSKTDQHGAGQEVAIWANPADPLLCPVAAVNAWLRHRGLAQDLQDPVLETVRRERPLFCAVTRAGRATGEILSDKAVTRLIKGAAARAGLDPEIYSGHSLRAGLATAAGDAGAALPDLMRQTRHKSTQVALAYLRPADLWRNNVTERVFRNVNDADS